ncbi:3-dehydroquinate synthase [Neolewinella lacunae]|uniref:3-dehydroquinate synthase n=1 Tax=Neolewinella lacunae TaxID=1517758 RepID=A0A923T7K3_9BACT|nr:3-dehydroquinate synthase [Neolewinella lacunae]MBC6993669.1 3-dehydroquinate synthase [Neolewinella lacunae]MDN3636364.1 3-dehydroquinate synthase [Neolewinella lacunae]
MTLPVADAYNIEIGGIGAGHFEWLRARDYAGWVVFVDTNTREHCLPLLAGYLDHPNLAIIEVPPGEPNKHLGTCQRMWEDMFRAGVGRRWCAIGLGGGVLADMSGFVSATFKRGIDFLQIPTTLLSMVDSSVGGKLGIDFFDVKNSIGVFANPIAVWIDPVFLQTLPPREIRSGYAEIIKHGLIADAGQWWELQNIRALEGVDWQRIIPKSVDVKRRIVLEDPFEKGLRKALNFGHTIGHAIESYFLATPQRLFHGEAIAAGMIMEAWLSHQLDELSAADLETITRYFLHHYGHQPIPAAAFDTLLALMQQDKKNEDHRINFTLLHAPGKARINATATGEEIWGAVGYYNERMRE